MGLQSLATLFASLVATRTNELFASHPPVQLDNWLAETSTQQLEIHNGEEDFQLKLDPGMWPGGAERMLLLQRLKVFLHCIVLTSCGIRFFAGAEFQCVMQTFL